MKAGEEARRQMVTHLGHRAVLTMDQLAEMREARPRLEKEMRLPGDTRGAKNRIYFFTIDGTLRGNSFCGCLLAGECIMVQSTKGFPDALRQAREGLQATLELAREWYEEASQRNVLVASPLDRSHLSVDVGGRRARIDATPALYSDPKLRDMLAQAFKLGRKA